mgnify:CR=1 FL=1
MYNQQLTTLACGNKLLWRHCCNKIAEAEAAVSVNEKKWLVMHMHVQLKLDELQLHGDIVKTP